MMTLNSRKNNGLAKRILICNPENLSGFPFFYLVVVFIQNVKRKEPIISTNKNGFLIFVTMMRVIKFI